MSNGLFYSALLIELFASGGFLAFIIKQKEWIFRVSMGILIAGFVFHTAFLGHEYYTMGTAPILDLKSGLSFFSWSLIAVYFLFHWRFRLMVLGSFVAPFAAFLMITSSALPWNKAPVAPIFKSLWLTVHVGTVFLGDGLFAITFLVAVMYLFQEYHIKRKRLGPFYKRLPSLKTLDRISHYALMYGFAFLTFGMISGSIYAQVALGTYWQWDPKEVWSLITWFFYAALLHERLVAGWQGRRAAVMAIVCFCVLIFTFLGVSFLHGGYHSFKNLGARTGL